MKISKAELRKIISEELDILLEGDRGEGSMAVNQLNNISQMTGELADLIDDSDDLDEWVESKITKAHDYLNTVLNHLSAEGVDPDFMPLKEGIQSTSLAKSQKNGEHTNENQKK